MNVEAYNTQVVDDEQLQMLLRKVRPKHVSALFLRHLRCARQPMTGRRDASLLAGMLHFPVSKYYLASANII